MVYTEIYTCFYGIYRDIYNPQCTYMVCLLPFPGGHPTQTCKFVFPTVTEDGETQESQASRDYMWGWSAWDWEDYNYAQLEGRPAERVLEGGIPWLNFERACLDLKLQISLHCCVIFRYQQRATFQE